MVSLLEQYETETQQTSSFGSDPHDLNNPFRTGFINASLSINDNEDIFKSQRVQINVQEKSIDQFEQCSSQMVILFKPKLIRFFNLKTKTDESAESPEAINKLFLDPTGKHLLIATETNELYYYSRVTKKFKPINKIKGQLVTAIGWNKNSTDKVTEAILAGTKKGLLFELCINTNNEGFLNSSIETYCKQVYVLGRDTLITGIEIVNLKKESIHSVENIYDIVITTPKRLYEFIGNDAMLTLAPNTPIFASIFSVFELKNAQEIANFYEMPGDIGYSQLQIRDNPKTKKKILAWMTGGGVLTYELDLMSLAKFSGQNNAQLNEITRRLISEPNQDIISYPQIKDPNLADSQDFPIGICLTEFHLALFYRSNIKILCLLNKELVLNQKFDSKYGKTVGIWCDMEIGDFGCYSNQAIIKYLAIRESRKIWRIYLSKNEFELAQQYTRDNPANLNLILTKQAEFLFNNKKYIESAKIYSKTQNSFEEICLKYLELGDMTALRTFLTYKLKTLDPEKLADYIQEKLYDDHESLKKEFYEFLNDQKVKTCLKESKEAIYKIFSSHGNMDDLVYFAEVMKDYPQIITHYLQEQNYRKALEALAKQNNLEIFYKYSPIFFELLPKEIVDLWIKFGRQLNLSKLLPSISSCDHTEEQANEAIRYLEYCIYKFNSEDQSIHNSLLSLYLQHRPEKLLEYVKERKDGSDLHFDKLMLARLCTNQKDKHLNEACVYLYRLMGWYEEAVDLALQLNVDLAREIANSVSGNELTTTTNDQSNLDELKKLLWLRIARHVIEKENDVNKAMEFLHELTDMIAIEDVLPYFPDFVTIDQFKDAIRGSLAAYTEKIQSLKENIDEAAKSAQLIRADIQNIRQKSININVSDSCSKCKYRLMTRRFYVFPCLHKFHSDCLYIACKAYLTPFKQKRIEELQRLLLDIQAMPNNQALTSTTSTSTNLIASVGSGGGSSSLVGSVTSGVTNAISHFAKSSSKSAQPQTYSSEEIIRLKSELDDLLANECPWCGERILKTIDEPFLDRLKYEEIYASWL